MIIDRGESNDQSNATMIRVLTFLVAAFGSGILGLVIYIYSDVRSDVDANKEKIQAIEKSLAEDKVESKYTLKRLDELEVSLKALEDADKAP